MEEKWFLNAKRADFNKWASELRIAPVTARIMRNRDVMDEDAARMFLYGTLEDCYSPWLLKDMDRAVEALKGAIDAGKTIRVIGDYDVDGICSAYILSKTMRYLGANVDTAIPHRIHDGYGLNDHLIELARQDGIELIVTCDNGIAAAPQIELAASLGIEVIVTDHHEVPFEMAGDDLDAEENESRKAEDGAGATRNLAQEASGRRRELLPPARAVIDPKRSDCEYPFKGICGAVVAYKYMQAMLETMQRDTDILEELLEFAAFATVCDVMELRDENRIIVKEGLRRMQDSRNLGLKSLIEINGLSTKALSAYHLGFVLGPCINATGRLDTAHKALDLLQSDLKSDAMSLARELTDLNASRKDLTLQGVEKAVQYIEEHHMEKDKVLVVFLPDVHESLAGIIAGRVRERYNRPTFVLTRAEEGVKGSGRSIEGYHMFDSMTEVKELFTKYGGHKMAAGLSIEEENVERLRVALNERCHLTADEFLPRVYIDVPMPLHYATEELARDLEVLEPFGVGNPKPLFAQKDVVFLNGSKMGEKGESARYRVRTQDGRTTQMVLFRDVDVFNALLDEKYGVGSAERLYSIGGEFKMSVAYQLGLNTYRGNTEKQLIIQHYQ